MMIFKILSLFYHFYVAFFSKEELSLFACLLWFFFVGCCKHSGCSEVGQCDLALYTLRLIATVISG